MVVPPVSVIFLRFLAQCAPSVRPCFRSPPLFLLSLLLLLIGVLPSVSVLPLYFIVGSLVDVYARVHISRFYSVGRCVFVPTVSDCKSVTSIYIYIGSLCIYVDVEKYLYIRPTFK